MMRRLSEEDLSREAPRSLAERSPDECEARLAAALLRNVQRVLALELSPSQQHALKAPLGLRGEP